MGDVMDHNTNRVESRRKLLKGALAASSVMSMGYSGAALASISCVQKGLADGGYPATDPQFFLGVAPPSAPLDWAWQSVNVNSYYVPPSGDPFDGFVVGSSVYSTLAPLSPVLGAVQVSPQPAGYPKQGWVLAYFDDAGNLTGTYPTYTSGASGATPATQSCLTSLNPGAASGSGFGG